MRAGTRAAMVLAGAVTATLLVGCAAIDNIGGHRAELSAIAVDTLVPLGLAQVDCATTENLDVREPAVSLVASCFEVSSESHVRARLDEVTHALSAAVGGSPEEWQCRSEYDVQQFCWVVIAAPSLAYDIRVNVFFEGAEEGPLDRAAAEPFELGVIVAER